MVDVLKERKGICEEKLNKLRNRIESDVPLLNEISDLCIYVTGSYGRHEANEHSDLDLFFVREGCQEENELPYVQKIKIVSDVVRVAEEMGFPEFTGGGEYLKVHYVDDIIRHLGSPEDDYRNYFTARLLLLLESKPLTDESTYTSILETILDAYFRDYSGHEDAFQALFLVNDIVRFWRTLCLNYESKRNPSSANGSDRPKEKDDRKNLKLKYSRLLTCFSAILPLAESSLRMDKDALLDVIQQTPVERLQSLSIEDGADEVRQRVIDNYSWFLDVTDDPKEKQLEWLRNPDNRNKALEQAKVFGDDMFKLLKEIASVDTMRFLVI